MIGARPEAIATAEDREQFREAMHEIGLATPEAGFARTLDQAIATATRIGFPVMIRPSFILGGLGTGLAKDLDDVRADGARGAGGEPDPRDPRRAVRRGMEGVRARGDARRARTTASSCAPSRTSTRWACTRATRSPSRRPMTLSDVEYQAMRDDAFAVLRRVGVETGGSNVQFAVDPATGERLVIEMNPRVSRSSALASKATGFPIAKIATRLAVGYRLDEIANDITKATPASFEPAIDYVVTKVPRWQFEKLPGAEPRLGHPDAVRRRGDGDRPDVRREPAEGAALPRAGPRRAQRRRSRARRDRVQRPRSSSSAWRCPTPDRVFELEAAAAPRRQRRGPRRGDGHRPVVPRTSSRSVAAARQRIEALAGSDDPLGDARRGGAAARQARWASPTPSSATLLGRDGRRGPQRTARGGVRPTFKTVDTCAAEFEAHDPVPLLDLRGRGRGRAVGTGTGSSSWARGRTASARASSSTTAACTRRARCTTRATRRSWSTATPRPCRPTTTRPTASTSSRSPSRTSPNVLDAELAASRGQGRLVGVVVTLGGQTPLKLAHAIDPALVLGTPPDAIDLAEDRERWSALCDVARAPPAARRARRATQAEARAVAREVGYPVLVRPSYVLGGRDMQLVYDDDGLKRCLTSMLGAGGERRRLARSRGRRHRAAPRPHRPVLGGRDRGGRRRAARPRPATSSSPGSWSTSRRRACTRGTRRARCRPRRCAATVRRRRSSSRRRRSPHALGVVGPCNVQFAVKDGEVYVLEANPRASRTAAVRRQGDGRRGGRGRRAAARRRDARRAARRGPRARRRRRCPPT